MQCTQVQRATDEFDLTELRDFPSIACGQEKTNRGAFPRTWPKRHTYETKSASVCARGTAVLRCAVLYGARSAPATFFCFVFFSLFLSGGVFWAARTCLSHVRHRHFRAQVSRARRQLQARKSAGPCRNNGAISRKLPRVCASPRSTKSNATRAMKGRKSRSCRLDASVLARYRAGLASPAQG